MSSSIRVIRANFFLRCQSLSWAPFETGSQLFELGNAAFRESCLKSIHLPASVTVIGAYIAAHLGRSQLHPAHNYLNLQTGHFLGVA
jgi:hypothetical protein